jgi:hypothetical protein
MMIFFCVEVYSHMQLFVVLWAKGEGVPGENFLFVLGSHDPFAFGCMIKCKSCELL